MTPGSKEATTKMKELLPLKLYLLTLILSDAKFVLIDMYLFMKLQCKSKGVRISIKFIWPGILYLILTHA